VSRKRGLFIPLLTSQVQATSSKRKSHFPNASYHLSNTFSCSQEASYATIYITSATDFLVVERRWNKTLFYNKHSKILHRISTVYNPEPVTLNKTLLTNVSAANQCPMTSTVSSTSLTQLMGFNTAHNIFLLKANSPENIKLHQVSLLQYAITKIN